MTKTIALTGASGFIGSRLAERLVADGWQVRALYRTSPARQLAGVTAVPGDLDDAAGLDRLLEGADAVVHCAGLIKALSAAEFARVNTAGTARLAEAAARHQPRPHFIYVSSLAAREPELSPYAASKRGGEAALAELGAALSWSVVRPAAVYGPGDRATLAFFRQLRFGIAAVPRRKELRLSMVYVEDVVAAICALLDAPAAVGAIFEVHDHREGGYSWPEIVAAAERGIGRRVIPVPVPKAMVKAAAAVNAKGRALAGGVAMLTPEKVNEIYHPRLVSRDRTLTELTGWAPKVGMAEGFRRTIDWYRREKWL